MPLTVIGVRHHSPACARLVQRTIRRLQPQHVLVEGPADLNDRIDELLLEHRLPVAVFTSARSADHVLRSWSPFCEHSPEHVALVTAREVGAQSRFMDLPAWDDAFGQRENRYSDAALRYAEVQQRLCQQFGVDNTDVLWDHLAEIPDSDGLEERLAAYFDLLRADLDASPGDAAREAYMASWIRAALADAGDREVVAVCGGYHRPALVRLAAEGPATWPDVPQLPADQTGGSFLVPFSFRRLDAFTGYASGMPSPAYYQDLWEVGPELAGGRAVRRVVARLRARQQLVSTADLVAAHALTAGLTLLRGHRAPTRTDVLDGLVSALVSGGLEVPLPWTGAGRLAVGSHPFVVEMVAALSGEEVGRLHPDTPAPPLVHDVAGELARVGLAEGSDVTVLLTQEHDRDRSRVLHRLRVLELPGWELVSTSRDRLEERWAARPGEHRYALLAEAGAYGATLAEAAGARLSELAAQVTLPGGLAAVLEDAVRCGLDTVIQDVAQAVRSAVSTLKVLAGMGLLVSTEARLTRHHPGLHDLLRASVLRTTWLLEGEMGAAAEADRERELAVVGLRDAGAQLAAEDLRAVLELAARLAQDRDRPADLRGACVGLLWALDDSDTAGREAAAAARAAATPRRLGDWLAGLFAVAREQVLLDDTSDGVLGVVDRVLARLTDSDFLEALPALRQAFAWFPPREREQVAALALARRGLSGSARSLLRTTADPVQLARARAVEARVGALLERDHLLAGPG